MEAADAYATAKANLRDTVKWLATTFAALAAVVLAGSPFSGFGALPAGSPRFWLAIAGLVCATIFFFMAWRKIVFLLRPDLVFPRQLRAGFNPATQCPADEVAEMRELHRTFEEHRNDLLPSGMQTFDELEQAVETNWQQAQQGGNQAIAALERYKQYSNNIELILNYATFSRLHRRIFDAIPTIAGWGALALLPLVLFAWAANPGKGDKTEPTVPIVQCFGCLSSEPHRRKIRLAPVLFDPGKANITASGLTAINAARNHLRENSGNSLLLLAHTDTAGSGKLNRDLARRRADAVRNALIAEGGLSGARIYISELPETDLPVLTRQEAERPENRAVEFLIVPSPSRTVAPSS
jgi:outer membrane protein OmpA-like peptidoglycan-associated protein